MAQTKSRETRPQLRPTTVETILVRLAYVAPMSLQASSVHIRVDPLCSDMSMPTSDDMSALESTAGDTETDADTIATRTRTKFSLVDVPIDTLEASLVDAAPLDLGGHVCMDVPMYIWMYPCMNVPMCVFSSNGLRH